MNNCHLLQDLYPHPSTPTTSLYPWFSQFFQRLRLLRKPSWYVEGEGECSEAVAFRLEPLSEAHGGLVKPQTARSPSRISNLVDLGGGQRTYISATFPGDADTPGPRTTLRTTALMLSLSVIYTDRQRLRNFWVYLIIIRELHWKEWYLSLPKRWQMARKTEITHTLDTLGKLFVSLSLGLLVSSPAAGSRAC